ncbi:hypothetical protein GX411_01065 [Candidatus Fermentibacteria bacterium]|nr:hypothetical protein [Candidatus Fermentibacteria bacterium]
MPALLAFLLTLQLPANRAGGDVMVFDCPEIVALPGDPCPGFIADGCGFSGANGDVLLPRRLLYIPLAADAEPLVEVVAEGVGPAPRAEVRRAAVDSCGQTLVPAAPSDLPSSWGGLVSVETWRRSRIAVVELHPVILRGGSLVRASRLLVRVSGASHGGRGRDPLLEALTGVPGAGPSSPRRALSSPFWGLPWARIEIDTAGVYALSCSDIPWAWGAPSASLAMYTGRGREMGASPWLESYAPRAVPILVSDGGDGIFGDGDSIMFFARGLSWWEPDGTERPFHFNHRFDSSNCYWLTWGGDPGARMQVLDAGMTGAPSAGESYSGRMHFEQDYLYKDASTGWYWFWDESHGTGTQWFYHPFECPGATGPGRLRLRFRSGTSGLHQVLVQLNDAVLADTSWYDYGAFDLEVQCSNLRESGNMLAFRIRHQTTSPGDDVYFDCFSVFPELPFSTRGQTQVPLERLNPGARRRVDWTGGLAGSSLFAVSGDTLAAVLEGVGAQAFEIEFPAGWRARELWVVPQGGFMSPLLVEEAEPGRIVGTLSGAGTVIVAGEDFVSDVIPLSFLPGCVAVSAQEVYDEFSGGVRDPGAIRAFVLHTVSTWEPVPSNLALVGSGHYDPLHRLSTTPCHIDILFFENGQTVGDDVFAIVEGSQYPQMAVSRIAARQRSEVQLVVQRALEYLAGLNSGEWQTRVLGAADDERSSKHSGDETYHTDSMERILEEHLPSFMRPVKHYLIFYDFNELWKKPEARSDYIALWSEGALLSLFLGHGAFDQLADEGLLYLEDANQLACGGRLPLAFFGSCDVGQFQNPNQQCIAQSITTVPAGGAVMGVGATGLTGGYLNETLLAAFLDRLFGGEGLTVSECLLLAKLDAGYNDNNRMYQLFGFGAMDLAIPPDDVEMETTGLRKGEPTVCTGSTPAPGLVLAEVYESCRPDTYYTFRQGFPIPYIDQGSLFYSGSAQAEPGFQFEFFVPVDARAGDEARLSTFVPVPGSEACGALFPVPLVPGSPSASDTTGPGIELWIDGFRNVESPKVSGDVRVSARLSDPSGINLLGNPGRQLALYVDGSPQDVSRHFRYDPGSSTDGQLEVTIGVMQEGAHSLELRASDCLLNRSSESLDFEVLAYGAVGLSQVFVYPCPASEGVSINWSQSGEAAVTVSVFTVAGRRILEERNIPSGQGYNQWWWDLRDGDGDPVASGTYVYRITAAAGGGSSDATGVLAVVRRN